MENYGLHGIRWISNTSVLRSFFNAKLRIICINLVRMHAILNLFFVDVQNVGSHIVRNYRYRSIVRLVLPMCNVIVAIILRDN